MVVFDTSVLVAAARSRHGASFALVSSIPTPEFQLCLSVGQSHIVTYNVKDFHDSEQLGVAAATPRDFLNLVRKQS